MGIKRFGNEGGAKVQHLQRGSDCTVEVYMLEESKCYGRGAAPTVRAAKSSEFGEEKL